MTNAEREAVLSARADECIKNWKFDCLASLAPAPAMRDAHAHFLKHQIIRHCQFSEYEAVKIAHMALEACRIALSTEKDCGREKDELGDDYFHVKMLKIAIESAKEVGIE